MGMFFKTLVAGIIAALLAGSVVYYGMPAPEPSTSIALRGNTQSAPKQDGFLDKVLSTFKRPARRDAPDRGVTPRTESPTPTSANAIAEKIRYYRLENGEFTEIDAPPARAIIRDSINPDASMRILSVMEQAAMIEQPNLRDRAYLGVVDYALSERLFVPASSATEKIEQVELRDTARSRIAITFAQRGDAASAFALIDEVEVNELRDVMRLQVIEALIPPTPPAQNQIQDRR